MQESLQYDDARQLTHIAFGAGGPTRDYQYDALGRLTSDVVKNASGAVLYQAGYAYDGQGNLAQKVLGAGQPGAGTHTYAYDQARRLTSWTTPGGQVTGYAWDGAGNRVQAGGQTYTLRRAQPAALGRGQDLHLVGRRRAAERHHLQPADHLQLRRAGAPDPGPADGAAAADRHHDHDLRLRRPGPGGAAQRRRLQLRGPQ